MILKYEKAALYYKTGMNSFLLYYFLTENFFVLDIKVFI